MTQEDKALATRPETTIDVLANPQRAATELTARFPRDLKSPEAVQQFIKVCISYSLDPFVGEIMPYEHNSYVTEAGWLKLVGLYAPGELVAYEARLATQEERDELGLPDGDWLAVGNCERQYSNKRSLSTERYGLVREKEAKGLGMSAEKRGYTPVEKEPFEIAKKRARLRALRSAFRDVLQLRVPGLVHQPNFDGLTIEGKVISREAVPEEEAIAAIEAIDADTARGEFFAKANDLGLRQSQIHGLLGLPCDAGKLHDVDPATPNTCKALSDAIKTAMENGQDEGFSWQQLTLLLEMRHKEAR